MQQRKGFFPPSIHLLSTVFLSLPPDFRDPYISLNKKVAIVSMETKTDCIRFLHFTDADVHNGPGAVFADKHTFKFLSRWIYSVDDAVRSVECMVERVSSVTTLKQIECNGL